MKAIQQKTFNRKAFNCQKSKWFYNLEIDFNLRKRKQPELCNSSLEIKIGLDELID